MILKIVRHHIQRDLDIAMTGSVFLTRREVHPEVREVREVVLMREFSEGKWFEQKGKWALIAHFNVLLLL